MNRNRHLGPSDPLFNEVMAVTSTVRALRRARGKLNPEDVAFGAPEWDAIAADFTRDVYRAMGGDPGELRRLDL